MYQDDLISKICEKNSLYNDHLFALPEPVVTCYNDLV